MENVVNFRGLNGFTTIQKKQMRTDLVFRSGELVDLERKDREVLFDKYQIKQIYDFRSTREINAKPDDKFQGVDYHHIDLMRDSGGQTTSLEVFAATLPASPDDVMKAMYKDIVLSQSGREGLHDFLDALVSRPGAAIFHCFAGKDRTGVAAALLLASLQVTPDQIMRDYLVTNQARKVANDAIITNYRKQGIAEEIIKNIETMMYVKAEYLEYGFAVIEENFGSITNYFKANDGLALDQTVIGALRHQYLL